MPRRRGEQRFALAVPWDGALRVPTDVTIERYGTNEIWVLSTKPVHRDELLTLDTVGSSSAVTMKVRVADSVPVVVDGLMRHRLRLTIVE
jgi:hypothetical protein